MTDRLTKFERFASHIRKHLLVLLVVAYVCSAYLPALGTQMRKPLSLPMSISTIHFMLAILLFVLGLSVPREKLGGIVKQSPWIAASLLARFIICLTLLVVCNIVPATGTAAILGLIVVMVAPAAASSAGWSMQIKADESTTVALIIGTTLISAITAPWILLLGQQIAPDALAQSLGMLSKGFTVGFVLPWIVLPTLLGIATRVTIPDFAKSLYRLGHALSPVVLLLLNYSNGSSSLPQLSSATTPMRAATILGGCVFAFIASRFAITTLASSRDASPQAVNSAIIGTVMSNTGLALVVATMAIPSSVETHLAIIVYTFVQHFAVATWVATNARDAGNTAEGTAPKSTPVS